MPDKIVAEFTFEKETKNTYRFQEDATPGKPPTIGTLYLQKYLFATQPQHISVEIIVKS